MGTNHEREPRESDGPTLYLESGDLDPTEAFCTEVFDGVEGEYRVVQLTATESFESLRDALDVQLERINDPSEAAVIITTPQTGDRSTVSEVGAGTPLYGFRVDPQDLTGISVAFSRLIDRWEETEGTTRICLRDVESLLPYHDDDLVYRFLNTVLATLQGAGAHVHVHLRPSTVDETLLEMLESLFVRVVEPGESKLESVESEERPPDATRETSETEEPWLSDAGTVEMSDGEVDAFLESEGYGVLAFAGTPPYAIPMSYGYDADQRVVYVNMSAYDGSQKQARLGTSKEVSLVVSRYERPDRWRSVVVDGPLTELPADDARRRDALEAFADSKLATVDVFDRDVSDIEFDWYALTPSDLSGRQSVGDL